METAELVLRSAGGLLAVLGTLWVLVKVVKAREVAAGRGTPVRLRVLARASVGRRASVVTVDAGDRVLVLGVTDDGVRLLAEQPALPAPAPPEAVAGPDLAPGPDLGVDLTVVPAPRSPLSGSLVDPGTWRQAVGAVREWTVRR